MEASEPVAPAEPMSIALAGGSSGGYPGDVEEPLSVLGLEFSLETASLACLEEVVRSVSRTQVADWFLRSSGTEEVALLSTCHRVELVLLVRHRGELERWREVLPGDRNRWRLRSGREAVQHLFRVAAGLESLATGEKEVRQQVRAAAGSVVSRHPRPVLRQLLLRAVGAADEAAHSEQESCSVASVAAGRLLELLARTHPRVLVIGSGTVGRQLVESLSPAAQVTVVYHQRPPEGSFLRATNARAVPFGRLAEEIAVSDVIVTATKSGDCGVLDSDLLRGRPVLLLDLGVPRNINPRVRELPNVRLVDLEELHALPRRSPGTGARAKVEEQANAFSDRLERLLLEPWVDAIRRAADEVRRAELATARSHLGILDPSQEAAIERLTQRLVTRLLTPATERIRALPPGREGDRERQLAVQLLRPRPPGR